MLKYIAIVAALFVSILAFAQEPVVHPIVNKPITIKPAQFIYSNFTVPAGATNVSVEGRFEASGGSGNDVEIFILDEDGFVNWQNGHRVHAYYSSGRMTQGDIEARLPSRERTFYLIFNNRFSLVSNKVVTSEINLSYNQQ